MKYLAKLGKEKEDRIKDTYIKYTEIHSCATALWLKVVTESLKIQDPRALSDELVIIAINERKFSAVMTHLNLLIENPTFLFWKFCWMVKHSTLPGLCFPVPRLIRLLLWHSPEMGVLLGRPAVSWRITLTTCSRWRTGVDVPILSSPAVLFYTFNTMTKMCVRVWSSPLVFDGELKCWVRSS